MPDLAQVTYCGLYCGLCAQRNRIPQRAGALREAMHKEAWDHWGQEIPRFREFWSFLNALPNPNRGAVVAEVSVVLRSAGSESVPHRRE